MESTNLLHQIKARANEIYQEDIVGVRYDENGQRVCYYCGKPIPGYCEKDHVTPRSRNGTNEDWNFVLSCTSCNASKRARFPLELIIRDWFAKKDMPDEIVIDFLARMFIHDILIRYRSLVGHAIAMKARKFGGIEDYCSLPFLPEIGGQINLLEKCSGCGGKLVAECSEGFFVIKVACTECSYSEILEAFHDDGNHFH